MPLLSPDTLPVGKGIPFDTLPHAPTHIKILNMSLVF